VVQIKRVFYSDSCWSSWTSAEIFFALEARFKISPTKLLSSLFVYFSVSAVKVKKVTINVMWIKLREFNCRSKELGNDLGNTELKNANSETN